MTKWQVGEECIKVCLRLKVIEIEARVTKWQVGEECIELCLRLKVIEIERPE